MSREATILHADADAFFAAVEQRDDARLRGRPVIVGPGVVMAASYEARAHGVRGGMPAAEARRLCPDVIAVPPRFDAYVAAGRALFALFERTAPLVEGLSLEEAFLDVRGLRRIAGAPAEIAERLRAEARGEVGLAVSVGVARTKVVAKMASRAAKPDGILVVEAGDEDGFLLPLQVERIWGVGAATANRLRASGITTVGELAELPREALIEIVGAAAGSRLHALAHNREWRPVRSGRRRRSFGAQRALGRRHRTPAELETVTAALVDRVTRRMRTAGRVGRTVVMRLRFDDFTRATRSRTLVRATAETRPLLAAARALLSASGPAIERRGLTLLGITITNVERAGAGVQLALPVEPASERLDAALDEVRDRFGAGAITRAALIRDGPGLGAELLAGEAPRRRRSIRR
jgi:DNA polymerase IV